MTSVIQPWIGISKVFAESGLNPVMWICAPNMQQEVGERFPDCEIIDSFEINKTQALFGEDLPHHPPKDMLLRVEFLRLKEQVMKMMDRQDDAAVYRRLEREAVFYSLFCYLYSKVVEKSIGLLVSAEAPHFPAQRILYAICQFLDIPCVHFQATRVAPLVFMLSDLHGSRVKLQRDQADTQVLERIVADYVKAFSEKKSWEEPLYVRQRRAEDAQASRLLAPIVRAACKGQVRTALRLAVQRLRPHYWRNSITQLYTMYSPLFLEDERLPSLRQAWRIHCNRKGLKKQLLRHYEELAVNVDMQVPYVYFPLHYEPERTTKVDKYFRDKFPEADSLLNYDVMAQDVLAGLRSLGVLR